MSAAVSEILRGYFPSAIPNRGSKYEHRKTHPDQSFAKKSCGTETSQNASVLAAESPDLYNAYQQAQFPKVEKAFTRAKYIASLIGVDRQSVICRTFCGGWTIAANKELYDSFGMRGFSGDRATILWFDVVLTTEFYATWRGRLVIRWPGLERSWWR